MSEQNNPPYDQDSGAVIHDSISSQSLLVFLKSKGLDNLRCELCDSPDWILSSAGGFKVDTIAQTIVSIDSAGFIMAAQRPFVFLFCAGCGNTKLMHADLIRARISPQDPENQELLDLIDGSVASPESQ